MTVPRTLVLVVIAALALAGPRPAAAGPTLAGCPVFPDDHVLNTPVDTLPVHPRSDQYIQSIGPSVGLHPDFGAGVWEGAPIGIPFTVVPGSQPRVAVSFRYDRESDPGPYPIPPDAPIEGGPSSTGDRHILIVTGGVFVGCGDVGGIPAIVTGADAGGGPHVRVFDARGGDRGGFFAYHPAFTGGVRVAVADLDGDGRGEIVTAAGPGGGPHVRTFSANGTPIGGGFLAY